MALVTSVEVIAGGSAVHVTVDDQNGDPLPPASIGWASMEGITIAPDSTGFLFSAAAGTAASALSTQATYSGPLAAAPVVGPNLAVVVAVGVTSLEYSSP